MRAYRPVEARERLERAIGLFGAVGDLKGAARAAVALADVELGDGRLEEAIARFEEAVAELEQGPPSAELAGSARPARAGPRHRRARGELALPPLDRALAIAERRQLPEVFVEALTSKGLVLGLNGRVDEARILLEAAVERAYAEELFTSALRAENNLAVILQSLDLHVEALDVASRCALLARRRGDRRWESTMRVGSVIHLYLLGRWDEAAAIAAEEKPIAVSTNNRSELLTLTLIHCWRGETDGGASVDRGGGGPADERESPGRRRGCIVRGRRFSGSKVPRAMPSPQPNGGSRTSGTCRSRRRSSSFA